MSAPSKLRRAMAGMAIGSAIITGGLAAGATGAAASTRPIDPGTGFFDSADDSRSSGRGFDWSGDLRKFGIEVEKRWPRSGRDGSNGRWDSFDMWQRQVRPELQRQRCRPQGFVRLYGTKADRGRFDGRTYIGGVNLDKTLVLRGRTFLVPSGEKLKSRSKANFVFLSKRGTEEFSPQPKVNRNESLERTRYSSNFLSKGVTYTVIVRYVNTCNEPVVDVLGKVRRR